MKPWIAALLLSAALPAMAAADDFPADRIIAMASGDWNKDGTPDLAVVARPGEESADDNGIHADDAGGLLAYLLEAHQHGKTLEDCYIGVDDAPAPLSEVVNWLREQLGVTEWSEEASVRRAGSKRCSNARAKALGWEPRYPSYREGYAAILAGQPGKAH